MKSTTRIAFVLAALLLATLFTTGLAQADNKTHALKKDARTATLRVTKAGAGNATITSSPVGINCGDTCRAEFKTKSRVTLTATAASGSMFKRWGGACKGTATTCAVTMKETQNVTAITALLPITLNVSKTGSGTGTVTSAPAGIDCGITCSATYPPNFTAHHADSGKGGERKHKHENEHEDDEDDEHNHSHKPTALVTLTATPATGSTFQGWTGACTGTATTCTVTMDQAQNVTASFALMQMALSTAKTGTGTGSITSAPAGIDCGVICNSIYDWSTQVTLAATPTTGSAFTGWSGACTGTAATCTVTMDQAQNVTADFASMLKILSLAKTGSGTGTITSSPAGINCGITCSATYAPSTLITLTATPATGSTFGGWLGACTGTATSCTVTLSQSRSVNATFSAPAVTTYQYDANGNLTQITDPLGRIRKYQFDALNQPVRQLEPHPTVIGSILGQIDTTYDSLGQVTGVIDPRNLPTHYSMDSLGNLLKQTSPDTSVTDADHDAAGNLKTRTDARGKTANYSYDSLNRISQIAYDDQTATYNWDNCANGISRLCSLTNNNSGTSYGYDSHGRITSKTQTAGATSLAVNHTYNAAGQRINSLSPGGQTIEYLWTGNRITAIYSNGQPLITRITYEPDGQVNGWIWGNNQQNERFYDLAGRAVIVSMGFDAPTQLPDSRYYDYDAAGRQTSAIDDADPKLNQRHEYDQLDRLTGSQRGEPAQSRIDYSYDLSGNRTGKIKDNTTLHNYTTDPNSNRLQSQSGAQSVSYSYDPAGNLTSDGTYSHSYNAAGRRITTTNTTTAQTTSYGYDALGQRVTKTVAGNTTQYFYDEQGHLTGEYDASGQLIQEIIWLGDLPVAALKPATSAATPGIYYIHADHLGTPRKITRPNDNRVVWSWESEAFGNSLPDQNPAGLGVFVFNLRFPGQYYDAETGLHYNMARYYNSDVGGYDQSDPIGLAGGINTYAYVGGNPVNFIDPRGLDIMVITGGISNGTPPNPFGHVGAAVSGYGMASYGNNTPLGGPVGDYLSSQGQKRNQQVTIIPTTPEQDALARAFIKQHPNKNDVGYFDNCAVRTNQIINAAGIPTNDIPFPGGTARDMQNIPGAKTYYIPQSSPIPSAVLNALPSFNGQ